MKITIEQMEKLGARAALAAALAAADADAYAARAAAAFAARARDRVTAKILRYGVKIIEGKN